VPRPLADGRSAQKYASRGGTVVATVPRVHIHAAVVIE